MLPPFVVILAPNLITSPPEELESDVKFKLNALLVALIADALVNCNCPAVLMVNVALLPDDFIILPVKVRLPAVIILDVASILILPDKVIAPAELMAPALLMPVPEIVIASATVILFEILNAAPEETVVAPAIVPSPFG